MVKTLEQGHACSPVAIQTDTHTDENDNPPFHGRWENTRLE